MDPEVKREKRIRRHKRVRAKISGTATRPRLSVFRSHEHSHLQLIDDLQGMTLAAASTLEVKEGKGKQAKAIAAAKLLAKRAGEAGIKEVVFDRSGYKFHGRVKAIAEAARSGGLKF